MRPKLAATLLGLAGLLLSGCLRGLVHDPGALAVAYGAQGVWPIHATSERPHWLLRSAPGWLAGHEAGYGLFTAGEAVASVRVVLFKDAATAAQGYARLTPEYLARSFPNDIALVPWVDPLRGEVGAAQADAYSYVIAAGQSVPSPYTGRLLKFRQGRVVALIASLGLSDVQLAAGATAMAREADRLDG